MAIRGRDAASVRVLYVDDDLDFLASAAARLEGEHDRFEVVTATTGTEGLEYLEMAGASVDCIVSANDMPGMDGLEFLRAVRESHPNCPFVLCAGHGSDDIAAKAIAAGADEYLDKDTATDQYTLLTNRIGNLVAQHRAECDRRATTERLRYLHEGLAEAIIGIDGEWQVTALNDRAETLLDRPEAELLDEPLRAVFETTALQEACRRAIEESEPITFEAALPRLDGRYRVQVVPIGDGLVIHLDDSTDDQEHEPRTRHQYERLRILLENVPVVLYTLDENGVFTLSEGRGLERLGLDPGDVVGESAFELHAGTVIADDLRRAIAGEAFRTTREIDGRVFESWYQPIQNGGTRDRVICVALDITERREQRRALEMARARFRSLTENVAFSVVTIDENNTVQYANDAVEAMFGYTAEELVGRSVDLIVPERLERTHEEAVARYLREGDKRLDWEWTELPARHRDGHEFPIGITFGEYVDDGTHLFTGVIRDISDQKRHERRLAALHDATRELMAATDPSEVATGATEAAAEVLGFELNAIHRYDAELAEFTPFALSSAARELFDPPPTIGATDTIAGEVFETGKPQLHEDVRVAANVANEETPIRSELTVPLGDHGVFFMSSTITDDIDEADLALAKMLAANVEVALERAEHERLLHRREAELERQNERLDRFASVLSHDLRNPLGVATGYLETIPEAGNETALEKIRNAHGRMERLIEDVLSIARQGTALEEPGSVELGAAAERAWHNVETGGAELSVSPDRSDGLGTVEGDRDRIERLFENLFRNAIEHGGREVTVRVGRSPAGFHVEDDGTGIPDTEREQVFAHGHTTGESGTGFGLAIVQRVVETHGWTIAVSEGSDGGARFDIEL